MDRMVCNSFCPLKVSVTIGTMLNFDGDFDRHSDGDGKCKQTSTSVILTVLILLSVHSLASSLASLVTSSEASAIALAQSIRSFFDPPSPLKQSIQPNTSDLHSHGFLSFESNDVTLVIYTILPLPHGPLELPIPYHIDLLKLYHLGPTHTTAPIAGLQLKGWKSFVYRNGHLFTIYITLAL